jgi:hypothetical protein
MGARGSETAAIQDRLRILRLLRFLRLAVFVKLSRRLFSIDGEPAMAMLAKEGDAPFAWALPRMRAMIAGFRELGTAVTGRKETGIAATTPSQFGHPSCGSPSAHYPFYDNGGSPSRYSHRRTVRGHVRPCPAEPFATARDGVVASRARLRRPLRRRRS